jgi:hypothetical protein
MAIDYKRLAVPAAAGLALGLAAAVITTGDKSLFGMSKKPEQPGRTVPTVKGMSKVEPYLQRAAQVAKIGNGFVPFGLAVAKREASFNNKAINDSPSEADAACRLYRRNKDGIYRDNPYGKAGFCWGSGGWWGFLPATAMEPKVFRKLDPRVYLFEPAASTAMFADYVRDIVVNFFPKLPPEHRNWLSIRRSMASLATMYDYKEKEGERARKSRERLAKDLKAVGYDSDWMYQKPTLGAYPGAAAVWDDLSQLETAAVA